MSIEDFQADDLLTFDRERLPEDARPWLFAEYVEQLEKHGPAITIRVFPGRIIFCGGVAFDPEHYEPRGWIWSFVPEDAAPYMLSITRIVKRLLATVKEPLFSTVGKHARSSQRWLKILGFGLSSNSAWPPGPDLLFERD